MSILPPPPHNIDLASILERFYKGKHEQHLQQVKRKSSIRTCLTIFIVTIISLIGFIIVILTGPK